MPRKPVNVDNRIDRHAKPQLYRNTLLQRKSTLFSKPIELSLMTGMQFLLLTRSIDENGEYQTDVASSSKPEDFASDCLRIFVPAILDRSRNPGPPHAEVLDRIRRARNRDNAHFPNPTIVEEKPTTVDTVLLGVLEKLKSAQQSSTVVAATADCSDAGTGRDFVASLDYTMSDIRRSIESTASTSAGGVDAPASQPNFTNYLYADKEVYHAHWPEKNTEPTLYSPLSQGIHFSPQEALAVASSPETVLKRKRRSRKARAPRKKTSLT